MIEFDLQQSYNRKAFDKFIKSFLPEDYARKEMRIEPNGFKPEYATEVILIGQCRSLNLDVYEIRHSSTNDARVGIAKDTFKLLQHNSLNNNALVAFVPEEGNGQWRFSLLQIELEAIDQTARIHRNYSNPRRFSYVLGPDAHVRTPYDYLLKKGKIRTRTENKKTLTPIEDLQSRFSVEVLSKEFYDNLFHWYLWATQHPSVLFPDKEDPDAGQDKSVKIIRLITRMLFVWFIKQKGLVPANLFDVNELDKVLKNFDSQSEESSCYYNAILQNLFFATLNRPVVDEEGQVREFAKNLHNEDAKNLYRYAEMFKISEEKVIQLFDKIPFLNASLFDCLDKSKTMNGVERCFKYDGFSRNTNKQAHIPNELFFGKEKFVKVKVDDKKQPDEIMVQGLVGLFERYNFTVEENSPREVEVSLDPELLGRVFENLLAAYNPETGKTVRKSTGSFYTPREIVNYMVNESLVAYLKQATQVDEALLRNLLNYDDDVPELTDDEKAKLEEAIKSCKVLDPACGSGAFPMGILQQLVHLWERIYPAASTGYTSRRDAMYFRKLYLIEHCIYGVDIQPIAMLISKLRFFISLICELPNTDFDINKRDENYGINTLPALETKFVAANTLIPSALRGYDDSWTQDSNLIQLKNELLKIRHENFISRSYSKKRNNMKKDEAKRKEIENYIVLIGHKLNEEHIAKLQTEIAKLEKEIENYKGECFVEEATTGDLFGDVTHQKVDINAKKRKDISSRIRRCKQAIAAEQQKASLQGFERAVKELTSWNPYDQNTSSPFFDPDWMFGIKAGFDIVIGNPPYIRRTAIPDDCKKQYEKIYQSATKQYDMYLLFVEMGLKATVKSGILCYINPIRFFNSDYGLGCRKFLSRNNTIISILDVSQLQVFETASTYPCIMTIKNEICPNEHKISYRRLDNLGQITNVLNCKQIQIEQQTIAKDSKCRFLIGECIDFSIVDIIERKSVWPLGEMYDVARGLANALVHFEGKKSKALKSTFISRYSIKDLISISTDKEHSAIFNEEMVILPRTVLSLSATLKPQNIICLDRIYYLKPISKYNNKLLLALLNSNILDYWFEINYFTTKIRGGYFDLNGDQLKGIPLPDISSPQQRPIIALVDKILAAKKADPQADTIALERKIDILVYLLYGLTYDEVMMVKNSLVQSTSDGEKPKKRGKKQEVAPVCKLNLDKETYEKWLELYTNDGALPSEEEMEEAIK